MRAVELGAAHEALAYDVVGRAALSNVERACEEPPGVARDASGRRLDAVAAMVTVAHASELLLIELHAGLLSSKRLDGTPR